MLGKLLKYDFKALSRVMFPLQGGTLLAVLIGVILVRLTVDSIISSTSYYSPYSSAVAYDGLFFGITSMLAALFGAVIFASSWVTLFFIGRHFFQSFLRDEGYLSFTLPVTTTQNLLSKTIAGATWILVNGAILLIGMLLLFVMGIPGNEPGLINTEILKYFGEAIRGIGTLPGTLFIIELLVLGIIGLLYGILQIYASLVIGAVLARTHKVLAGIGIYVAISMISQTVYSITMFIAGLTIDYSTVLNSDFSWLAFMQVYLLPPLIVSTAFAVTLFLVSRHLLHTRLNLE